MQKNWLERLRGKPLIRNLERHYGAETNRIQSLAQALESQDDEALASRAASAERAEQFAIVYELVRRKLGLKLYPEQLIAGLALDDGAIVELPTGQGKTVAAVAPACRAALAGEAVQILTFNDYLARRDAEWMRPIYDGLQLNVGVIQKESSVAERQQAYAAQVTYATAKEVGFDLLRDQLIFSEEERVLRPFGFTIVDEADSILIDEARAPLVIAGSTEERFESGTNFAELARRMQLGAEFELDEGGRNVQLTSRGIDFIERELSIESLHAADQSETLVGLQAALHAQELLERNVDYLVDGGRIQLIEELTGRVVPDRHLPDGLQAALEAKEGLTQRGAGTILGSTSIEWLLKSVPRISGMTATASGSCDELFEHYGLKTVVIPPHQPSQRIDEPDRLFHTVEQKLAALLKEIKTIHATGRPILVGTMSVAESYQIAASLREADIRCSVLNAERDHHEARVIAEAGSMGAVTISTNMAGRGTDIKLGGEDDEQHPVVAALGGLYVIGTNRHESSRIDDQLRGRAGRQGDPGSSRFFISLEDPLMVRFGLAKRLPKSWLGEKRDGEIENSAILAEVDRTQRIVDGQNGDIRLTLSNYSHLIEQQWEILEPRRRRALERHRSVERARALATIDQLWSDHLNWLNELRDGIHLRTLARLDPLSEFHVAAIARFSEVMEQLDRRIEEAVSESDDVKRPSSTWTYIISDDPFRDQLFAKLGGTAMGLGIVFNLPLIFAWLILKKYLERPKR